MRGIIDTNILIYGSAESAAEYLKARSFLEGVLAGDEDYGMTWINAGEYLSFTTQAFLGSAALRIEQAVENISRFLRLPSIHIISEGERHWQFLEKVIHSAGPVRGGFIHDCRIAAIMLENGVDTIYTRDADFRKIPQLKVIDPLAG